MSFGVPSICFKPFKWQDGHVAHDSYDGSVVLELLAMKSPTGLLAMPNAQLDCLHRFHLVESKKR